MFVLPQRDGVSKTSQMRWIVFHNDGKENDDPFSLQCDKLAGSASMHDRSVVDETYSRTHTGDKQFSHFSDLSPGG